MIVHPRWCPDISNGYFFVVRWNKSAQIYKVNDDSVALDAELENNDDVNDICFSNDG